MENQGFENKVKTYVTDSTLCKDELVLIHLVFFQMKLFFEKADVFKSFTNLIFKEYDELGVLPSDIQKSRLEHIKAIYLLRKAFLSIFEENRSESEILNKLYKIKLVQE